MLNRTLSIADLHILSVKVHGREALLNRSTEPSKTKITTLKITVKIARYLYSVNRNERAPGSKSPTSNHRHLDLINRQNSKHRILKSQRFTNGNGFLDLSALGNGNRSLITTFLTSDLASNKPGSSPFDIHVVP